MPNIDPNVVAWFSVISSIVTALASLTAAFMTIKHYLYAIRTSAKKAVDDVEGHAKDIIKEKL